MALNPGYFLMQVVVCSKLLIFNILSSIFSKIHTFGSISGPFPDEFLEKSPDPDQSPEKTDQMGALILSKYCINTARIFSKYRPNIGQISPKYYPNIIRILSKYCQDIV